MEEEYEPELLIYDELREIQKKIASLRERCRPYLQGKPELKNALSLVRIRVDMALDIVEAEIEKEYPYSPEE